MKAKHSLLAALAIGLPATTTAKTLTFEEVGDTPATGVHYFSQIGDFTFTDTYMGPGTPLDPMGGIRLINATDNPNNLGHMVSSPKNAVSLSFDYKFTMTKNDGGLFDFIGADFGHSHAGANNNFVAYRDGEAVYSTSFFSSWVSRDGGSLSYQHFDWQGIDTLEFWSDHYTMGLSTMDNLQFETAAVPLPAAVWLFGSALMGLVLLGRKEKPGY